MNRSLKWILLSIGLVALILIFARIAGSQSLIPKTLSANFLSANNLPEDFILVDKPLNTFKVGKFVEVHKFDIEAGFPYSLRYLSFQIESENMEFGAVQDFFVYESTKDKPDFARKVGQGENFENGLLKIRFFSEKSKAYFGEGKQSFALIAPVKKFGEESTLKIIQTDSNAMTDFYKWAWEKGHIEKAWGF